MDDSTQELPAAEKPNRWAFLISWPSFLLAALIIYELTAQASLTVTILCSKLGWQCFATAYWLRCRDPNRARGKVGFWIFGAGGLWRTAMAAVVFMLVYSVVYAMIMGSIGEHVAGPVARFAQFQRPADMEAITFAGEC